MPEEKRDLDYSFALVRKIPGAPEGEERSMPHVYQIITRKSKLATRRGSENMDPLPSDWQIRGLNLRMIRLYAGQNIFHIGFDPLERGAYFVRRMHGEDDGYLGTSSRIIVDSPSAISAKVPQVSR